MVGIAVGNLLGIPYERDWNADEIRAAFPNGVREIVAKPGWPDDDDLAQSVILAEASIGTEQYDIDDLARRFWAWAEINGSGMGGLTRRVLRLFGGAEPRRELREYARHGILPTGRPPREPMGCTAMDAACIASRERKGSSAGNGAVMRCAPVALRWEGDLAVVRNSVVGAAVTHRDPRCLWAAALVNLAVARCLRGSAVDGDILLAEAQGTMQVLAKELHPYGMDAVVPDEVAESVYLSLGLGVGCADLRLGPPNSGFVLKAMRAALWCARHPRNFEDGLSDVVSAGGDTDSNGAIAGAVLGARFGVEGIPRRWRDMVVEIRNYTPPVPNWVPRERLDSLADRVLAAGAGNPRPGTDRQTPERNTPGARAKGRLQVLGRSFDYMNAKEALSIVLCQLQRADPTFLKVLADHPKCLGRRRRALARTKQDLYPGRPDLQAEQSVELVDGWFLATNSNNGQKMAIIRTAAEVAGLEFGDDIVVDL